MRAANGHSANGANIEEEWSKGRPNLGEDAGGAMRGTWRQRGWEKGVKDVMGPLMRSLRSGPYLTAWSMHDSTFCLRMPYSAGLWNPSKHPSQTHQSLRRLSVLKVQPEFRGEPREDLERWVDEAVEVQDELWKALQVKEVVDPRFCHDAFISHTQVLCPAISHPISMFVPIAIVLFGNQFSLFAPITIATPSNARSTSLD
ncbi:hypothetical protein JB92DRAFT_3130530 [Gautieria morchelliformis]|nr:hypothetical protein JB92DRAFT_3130530 [Gautieria morchelliformis]